MLHCKDCKAPFRYKSHLTKHLDRKTPCVKVFTCILCNKIFRNELNLDIHKDICNINKNNIHDIEFYNIQCLNSNFDNLYPFFESKFKYLNVLKKELANNIDCSNCIDKLINLVAINSICSEHLIFIFNNYYKKNIKNNNNIELDCIIFNLLYKLLKKLYKYKDIHDYLKEEYRYYINFYRMGTFPNYTQKYITQYKKNIYNELCKLELDFIQFFDRMKNGNPKILHENLNYRVT